MNFKIEEIKSAANSGDVKAKSKLASLHMMGAFPGANPTEGVELLKQVAVPDNFEEMIELGILYLKGNHVAQDKEKGLNMIEQGVSGLGGNVPFEHCFGVGMELSQIKEERWQKLSAKLLESAVNDTEGMRQLETHMGQQGVMMVKGMLQAVKGWLASN